jgi:hypothetical protein
MWISSVLLLLSSSWRETAAFSVRPGSTKLSHPPSPTRGTSTTLSKSTLLLAKDDATNNKNGRVAVVDEGVRNKLLSETIAPWSSLRLFLYASLGAGAAIGGLLTLGGTVAALSGARSDLELNTQVRIIVRMKLFFIWYR